MKPAYVPKLGFGQQKLNVGGSHFTTGHVTKNAFAQGSSGPSFKDVMFNTVNNVNDTVNRPNEMMQEAIVNGTYDVHDVMLASAKAELAVTISSQFVTKVVQAYDKILQIQI